MIKKTNNIFLFLILFIISVSLIIVFAVEYGLGHQPCKLCIYERIPYILSIFFILELILFKRNEKITLLLISLIFAFSAILAFYHFGIEQGLFTEAFICESKNSSENLSKDQLLEQLKQSAISCKDVNFKILGFSLASINIIFSTVMSVIFLRLFKNYEKN
jgi:disulfide bond formation protein DsbB|tara:strand:+ start:709 stop:1191 length:483 start_codon:yes stop_codon:yes gene_type:complete